MTNNKMGFDLTHTNNRKGFETKSGKPCCVEKIDVAVKEADKTFNKIMKGKVRG